MALKVSGGKGEEAVEPGGPLLVKDRFEVHPDHPLPHLDNPPAVAVRTTHTRDGSRQIYALVCDPKMPPRLDIVSTVHRVDHRNLQRVVDWSVLDWPQEGRRCPVVVMEQPQGDRVFPQLTDWRAPMTEEAVTRLFLAPVVSILRDMHALGVHHRNIRPNNLYFVNSDDREMCLGECFTAQPGTNQTALFETMECGLAAPAGRGEGGAENDLYAVGATAIALLTGKVPMAEKTDEEVMLRRLNVGSYAALVHNQRISLTMMEPLRGLLNDDPKERWTLEDLSLWLNGRRLSPKQQVMPTKASRAYSFAGRDYFTARELAHAMHRHWDSAVMPIRDGSLDTWLRRGLSEDDRVEAVNQAKGGVGQHDDDKLIARVLIALDPEGPVRLRDFSATIEGIGSLVGLNVHDANARTLFARVNSMGLGQFWLEQQRKVDPNQLRYLTRMDKAKMVMNQPGLGFGIERVAYELNPNLPCLSPLFERDYIATIEHLLPAYERLAQAVEAGRVDPVRRLIDRDSAAYIGVNYKRPSGTELRDIEREGDDPPGRIAQIRLLANIQDYMHKKTDFPALCALAATILEPAIERFQSRERRARVRDRLRKAARGGRLSALLDVVDDQQEVANDQRNFESAVRNYAASVEETIQVKRDIKNRSQLAHEVGGQLASTFSALGATVTALITFIVWWF
ncbi:hypothetical protein KAJ83_05765 [Marivibrio halodurans]|uniref:Protein kinase domain-containing protein n=1 Tax=Marivibrio halodurans TaxID=2039722 RepID=A0A8J7SLV3_9PROT|nr:hypothetical protein [Marivibrio halodurans]MBP5856506.1 hypothetical protein [Marivibrio halodurans]